MKDSPFCAISMGADSSLTCKVPAPGRVRVVGGLRIRGTDGCASMWCVWHKRSCQSSSARGRSGLWPSLLSITVLQRHRCCNWWEGETGEELGRNFSLLLVLVRTKSFHSPVVFSSVRLGFLIKKSSPDLSVLLGNAGSSVRHGLSCELHAKRI